MRKFFALALAVAMVLSLASVSFAAVTTGNIELAGPYRYDADKNVMIDVENDEKAIDDKDMLRYGSGVYYAILIDDDTTSADDEAAVKSYKKVEKLKAKAEFEMGEALVESVSIVKKYVDVDNQNKRISDSNANPQYPTITKTVANGGANITDSGYYYFVEVKVASKDTTSEADIAGTIEFDRKADANDDAAKNIGKLKDEERDIAFTVFYKDSYVADGDKFEFDGTADSAYLKYDTNYALKFNDDEEIELEFGAKEGTNEGTFTVDVSGQGKVFLKYNTKANEAIVDANPGVEMFFLNFNNCKFNRVGEFVYEMEDMVAAYKVVGDQLVEIKGLEIDGEEAVFNTRVLESYVFATAELVNPAAAVEAPVVEAPAAVTNPSTGA